MITHLEIIDYKYNDRYIWNELYLLSVVNNVVNPILYIHYYFIIYQ